jgi:hypothetical protein
MLLYLSRTTPKNDPPTDRQLLFTPGRTHKKYHQPYIGIVEGNRINHPDLLVEKRARMKILLIDPTKDLPISKLNRILKTVLALYK